jgi:hypothetical protein
LDNLNISSNVVGEEMLIKLAPSLMHRINLKKLAMDNCRLTIKGLSTFFSCLKTNHSITDISIASNDMRYPEPGDTNPSPISEKELKELEANLVEFLTLNQYINMLSFSHCQVGDQFIRALGRGLTNNRSLHQLVLSHNLISDDSMTALIKGVLSSPLTHLDLSSNQLKCGGASVLSAGLRHPECKLLELNLSNNFISLKGMNELHVGLASNRKLLKLRTEMNVGIPHADVLKIKATLRRNRLFAQSQRFPKLILEKHFLKKNSTSWRSEFV